MIIMGQLIRVENNNEVFLRVNQPYRTSREISTWPGWDWNPRASVYWSNALTTELQVKLGAGRQMMVFGLFDISKQILVSSISRQ